MQNSTGSRLSFPSLLGVVLCVPISCLDFLGLPLHFSVAYLQVNFLVLACLEISGFMLHTWTDVSSPF